MVATYIQLGRDCGLARSKTPHHGAKMSSSHMNHSGPLLVGRASEGSTLPVGCPFEV